MDQIKRCSYRYHLNGRYYNSSVRVIAARFIMDATGWDIADLISVDAEFIDLGDEGEWFMLEDKAISACRTMGHELTSCRINPHAVTMYQYEGEFISEYKMGFFSAHELYKLAGYAITPEKFSATSFVAKHSELIIGHGDHILLNWMLLTRYAYYNDRSSGRIMAAQFGLTDQEFKYYKWASPTM